MAADNTMPNDEEYNFPAPILRLERGMFHHYIPLPDDIADALLASGTRRIVGHINGKKISRAIHRHRDGGRILVVSRRLMSDVGAGLGDLVELSIKSDPNPDHVVIDPALLEALEMDREASDRVNKMTPGQKRSINHYVANAKRLETKMKRALEIAYKLRTRTLSGDRDS